MGIIISLNSCNNSSSFSQRKYRKGIFKESSVKISRDRTKQKEIHSTTNAEAKPKEQITIKKIKQNRAIHFIDSINSNKKPFDHKEDNNSNYTDPSSYSSKRKTITIPESNEGSIKLERKKKKSKLTKEQKMKRGKVMLSISVVLCIVFVILCIVFILKLLLIVAIIFAILFLIMLGIAIWSKIDLVNLKKQRVAKENA